MVDGVLVTKESKANPSTSTRGRPQSTAIMVASANYNAMNQPSQSIFDISIPPVSDNETRRIPRCAVHGSCGPASF